ncbi:uncharacterized protein BX664DRAFT_327696 [Halteromyces radiatus]|uniref:uncharacterized protein n=1 Tax=Halteromyces radiatus TaxID=101107 RepID=UPI002220A8A2|nr:uncharacterized protein BX664DRAFT_327696 [Halteromyces radiatus]KAI8092607.1 hypothetical protein BX664DRAFT_327696 [Halteromyces radiatus]
MQSGTKRRGGASKQTSTSKRFQALENTGQKKIDLFFKKPRQQQSVQDETKSLVERHDTHLDVEKSDSNNKENGGSQESTNTTTIIPLVDKGKMKDTIEPVTTNSPFFETSMYTDQIHEMLMTVLDGESFLFSAEDHQRFINFKQLPLEPQHLFVRLWMRKQRRWLRLDKLDYSSNIRDIHQACNDLLAHNMVHVLFGDSPDARSMEWPDILALFTVEELKDLAQSLQCLPKEGKSKSDLIEALTLGRQQTLDSMALHDHSRQDSFNEMAKSMLGTCIILDKDYDSVFQRLNIVYYRLSDPTETNSMRSAILAKLSRRHYPNYIYCRTSNVWTSIEDLDHYENAFRLQYEFETKMENIPFERRRRQLINQMDQQATNGNTNKMITKKNDDIEQLERQLWMDCWIMCENIIGTWEDLIQQRNDISENSDERRFYYMRRFEAGYIYTHMIEHGTKALGKLQEYSLEALILQKLIDQRIYRIGKRGKWYDRLALIQANYLKDLPERQRKKMALQTCICGIQDPRVHQIHLNALQRRIQRLERDLCIPKREQHDFSYLTLKKPSERTIHAERISDTITGKKSSWRGDDGAEISVETVAIQYYNKQGYQGLHTENGIITMLFMLLFWDIVFSPVPGAFETPYQTAPLDLWSDAFYIERMGLINERIAQIGQEGSTLYLDIIKKIDDEHRPLQTMCAGINWNYEQVHLLEIAECIGPESLSSLCHLLAEEFGHRLGGMPDLCCWNYTEKKCVFVEGKKKQKMIIVDDVQNGIFFSLVKGPGDKLSETQKIWLDTLSNMGIAAEVCYVKIWDGEDILLNN